MAFDPVKPAEGGTMTKTDQQILAVQSVTGYRCSDGQEFTDRRKAEEHAGWLLFDHVMSEKGWRDMGPRDMWNLISENRETMSMALEPLLSEYLQEAL